MLLYGKPVAQKIYQDLKKEILKLDKNKLFLAVVLVGEKKSSLMYVKVKEKVAENLKIPFKIYHFPEIAREEEIKKIISDLNKNKFVAGIIVQLPLSKKFDTESIIQAISYKKDIDGLLGGYAAPTASAILEIFSFYDIDILEKNIVIVGRGRLVGAPLEKILKERGIFPTVCDSRTANLKEETLKADILIAATGKQSLIKKDMVKQGAIVIDAGTSEEEGLGDVDPSVYKIALSYTPNPGGVGPVTVACLMRNLIEAAK